MKDNINEDRFINWKYPDKIEGQPTKYNWIVQNLNGFDLSFKVDLGTFSYINALYGVPVRVIRSISND